MIKNTFLKKSLHVLFAIAIGMGIIWLSIRKLTPEDKTEILASFRQANYWWIILSLIVGFISNISRSIRWKMLLKPLGYRPHFGNVMMSVLVAYFANMGLPRLGEVVRCGLLNTHEKVPFEKSLGTVVTERILDLIVFVSLFVINFFIQFNKIHAYIEREIFSKFDFSISVGLIIVAATLVVIAALLFAFRKRLAKHRFYQKIKHLFEGFWLGIKSISKIDKPLLFIFHSLFIWFCYWLMAYLVFQSLPVTQNLETLASLTAFTTGAIGMIIVQGGLGIYPLLIAGSLVVYGISYPLGYAMGWLMWGGQTIGIIIAGVLALILIPLLNKTEKHS